MASELLIEPTFSPAARDAEAPRSGPIGVMLLISSLEHGGAERQVVELARNLDRTRFTPMICSLSKLVPLASRLPNAERDLVIVEKRWRYDFSTIRRVADVMRERAISVVHAFLFDSEMTARFAARMAGVRAVIASERNTDYVRPWVQSACLKMTRSWFDVMIANSNAGMRFNMRTMNIPAERIRVVRNGVNTDYFKATDAGALRRELGFAQSDQVVGMVASFKKQKRHADFFAAARLILDANPNTRFLCVGEPLRDNQQRAADYHREMRRLVEASGIAPRIHFIGARSDMPAVYSLCDVTMLTSEREGTPNVLLESMACQTPVVATDVSDNAQVVLQGEVGQVVPLGDVGALAASAVEILKDDARRGHMGAAARAWVKREFSNVALARRTEAVYAEVLKSKGLWSEGTQG